MRLFTQREKRKRLRSQRQPRERVRARLGGGAVAGSTVVVGRQEVRICRIDGAQPDFATQDHAVLALAAISMSRNIEIDVDFPCSEAIAITLTRLERAYRLWSIDALAPLRVNIESTQADPSASAGGGIICLSGGLDSMSAAIEAVSTSRASHGLLIAGADYADASSEGFVELRARVDRIATRLGLELVVLETNLRRKGFKWEMLHGFVLGHCLHFLRADFTKGFIAQDNDLIQDSFRFPWGSFHALPELMSTPSLTLNPLGLRRNRVEKLRHILEYDESLLHQLSVCWTDRATGGNCGACAKCIQTRSALIALGRTDQGLFDALPPIAPAVRAFEVPDRFSGVRGRLARTWELVNALPDGEIRDAYEAFEGRLRDRLHELRPPEE